MIILGSGGAARAALVAAMRLGAGWVTIRARDVERAAGLLREAGQPGEALAWDGPMPRSGEAAVLFNATSLGMAGQPGLTFDLGVLAGDGVVFDAVYVPLETELLRGARERGLATIDGLAMLIGQAALAFEMFFGVAPPRADGDAELRAVLRR
jgi:shikimate dehydrogenase